MTPLFCGLGAAFALSRLGGRCAAEGVVATLVNAYTCAVSLYLSLPYTADLDWPLP